VNVHTKFAAKLLPNVSAAPVVIVAVKGVVGARATVGVKVATFVAATYETVPATLAPFAVKVNVVVLIVAGFIALLNVAVTTAAFGQTSKLPFGGVTAVTVGGTTGLVPMTASGGQPHPTVRTTASISAVIEILLIFNRFIFSSSFPYENQKCKL
jgi:hypothetical protein